MLSGVRCVLADTDRSFVVKGEGAGRTGLTRGSTGCSSAEGVLISPTAEARRMSPGTVDDAAVSSDPVPDNPMIAS